MGMVSACHCVFVCVTVMLSVAFHLRRHLGQRVCYALLDSSVGVLCASVLLFVVIKNEACPFARALRSSSCALTLRFFKLLKTKKCCQVPKREGEWEREIERERYSRDIHVFTTFVSVDKLLWPRFWPCKWHVDCWCWFTCCHPNDIGLRCEQRSERADWTVHISLLFTPNTPKPCESLRNIRDWSAFCTINQLAN